MSYQHYRMKTPTSILNRVIWFKNVFNHTGEGYNSNHINGLNCSFEVHKRGNATLREFNRDTSFL